MQLDRDFSEFLECLAAHDVRFQVHDRREDPAERRRDVLVPRLDVEQTRDRVVRQLGALTGR